MSEKNFHIEQKNFKNKFGFEIDFRATVGSLKKALEHFDDDLPIGVWNDGGLMIVDNNEIVKQLKESIEYRNKHKEHLSKFKYAIITYFQEKYGVNVRVKFFVDCFGIDQNFLMDRNAKLFKFNQDVLYEFCKEFDCEFKYTACDGSRPIFTFKDVDTAHAFILD